MTTGRRIASARIALGLDQKGFAELIGANLYTLRDWEQGRHEPRLPMLRKIAAATGKPVAWFLNGQPHEQPELREMLERTERELGRIRQQLEGGEQSATIEFLGEGDFLEVPFITGVPAGPWAEAIEHPDTMMTIPAMFVPQKHRGSQVFVLRLCGDSMEGMGMYDGSLIVACIPDQYDLGDIVIARRAGEVTVKRYAASPEGAPYLLPENARYDPIPIDDQTELVGKVVGVYTPFED